MAKYSIGVDYGSLSGRTVLVNLTTGKEEAVSVLNYAHAVMSETLPDGTPLGKAWALQHPQDYLDVLQHTIPDVLRQAKVKAEDVVGVGIDFTACTVLPIKKDGTPLCFLKEYASDPHAYVKLWKHHAAQEQANRLNEIARQRGETFLARYGGKISSEWMIPKVMQLVEEAPYIYDAMDKFIEAADWIVMMLTGRETRNACTAGYKALWHKRDGFPDKEFFKALHPKLENFIAEKIGCPVTPLGEKAGEINAEAALLTGLKQGTAVAVGNVDAHVSLPAVGIVDEGKMLMIMGTSTCDILLGTREQNVSGICGVVEDGVLPGFLGYEAGQSCVGDHFAWLVENCVPQAYFDAAKKQGKHIQTYLTELAQKSAIGESGLLALDWWNGNRSVLVDTHLTGVLLGCTLQTKPEEIYRALIEATAYGKRMIIDTFVAADVPIDKLYAAGGIAEKNPMMMQIYADVTGREIYISGSPQAPALGSAMFGAVAAGAKAGGFDTMADAVKVMAKLKETVYKPIPENVKKYDALYREYAALHDYFGRGENNVLKRLLEIKKHA